MVQTFKENKEYFTINTIKGEDTSQNYLDSVSTPGTSNLKRYVKEHLINNCKIKVDGISKVDIVYGP